MTGHWYLLFRSQLDGEECEWVVPAHVPKLEAIDQAKRLMPGYSYVTNTWRASFDQRSAPSDSQPSYGQLNDEQITKPLFHSENREQVA